MPANYHDTHPRHYATVIRACLSESQFAEFIIALRCAASDDSCFSGTEKQAAEELLEYLESSSR